MNEGQICWTATFCGKAERPRQLPKVKIMSMNARLNPQMVDNINAACDHAASSLFTVLDHWVIL